MIKLVVVVVVVAVVVVVLSQNGLPYLIVLAHVVFRCASTVITDSPRSTLSSQKGLGCALLAVLLACCLPCFAGCAVLRVLAVP